MEEMDFGNTIVAIFFGVVSLVLMVAPFWMLWKRTGHSGWISLTMLVPFLNLIMLYVLAFKSWPIEKDLDKNPDQDSA